MNIKKIISGLTLALVFIGSIIPFQAGSQLKAADNAKLSFEIKVNEGTTNEFKLDNVTVKDGTYQVVNIHTKGLNLEENTAKKDPLFVKSVQTSTKEDTAITLKKSTADQVKTFLNNLVFESVNDNYPENGKINIDLENDKVYRIIDKDGVNHYYQMANDVTLSWLANYNIAKTKKLKNLKGYLATLTSADEEKFTSNLATTSTGFNTPYNVGGTRAVKLNFQRIKDDESVFGNGWGFVDGIFQNEYYWADGPEAGETFWSKSNPNAGYSNWNDGAKFGFLGYGLSTVMVTNNFGNQKWGAYPIGISTAQAMVEFSEYNGQKENRDDSEAVVPKQYNEKALIEHYVDQDGNKIIDDEVVAGNIGDEYTADQKDLTDKGYDFDKVSEGSAPLFGVITEETQQITFIYKAKKEDQGTVIVRYVDGNRKDLVEPETLTGNVGDKYKTEKKNLIKLGLRYKFSRMGKDSAPAEGKFTHKEQTVMYVYKAV